MTSKKKFKISFKFPANIDINQIKALEKKDAIKSAWELSGTQISIFLGGKLYRPPWSRRGVNFSDTLWLLDFFPSLMDKLVSCKDGEEKVVWFVDNPIWLKFTKEKQKTKIWIEADNTSTLPVTIEWKDFVKECVTNAENFVAELITLNKHFKENTTVKELIKQIEKSKETLKS